MLVVLEVIIIMAAIMDTLLLNTDHFTNIEFTLKIIKYSSPFETIEIFLYLIFLLFSNIVYYVIYLINFVLFTYYSKIIY
jgi:hypothetical protein